MLLRHAFPDASYHLLEDPDTVARLRADPRSFLDEVRLPVILDEIQNVPEILNYVRARIDRTLRKTGQWLLTGSHEAPLMKGVTESMAGRAAILQLLTFSSAEHPNVSVVRGGFPEVIARPKAASLWFRSYIQTYLEGSRQAPARPGSPTGGLLLPGSARSRSRSGGANERSRTDPNRGQGVADRHAGHGRSTRSPGKGHHSVRCAKPRRSQRNC